MFVYKTQRVVSQFHNLGIQERLFTLKCRWHVYCKNWLYLKFIMYVVFMNFNLNFKVLIVHVRNFSEAKQKLVVVLC